MWRAATVSDEGRIVEMCRALYAEDPSPMVVSEEQTRNTLSILLGEPSRGRAVVLEADRTVAGYALLISFWSNELGGEIIVIDELYVTPAFRNQGYARQLLRFLAGQNSLWPGRAVALELEVTPQNTRAAAIYTGLGFQPVKNQRMRLHLGA